MADFIGESNLFTGTVRRVDGDRVLLDMPQGLQLASPATPTGPRLAASEPGCIAVRPEQIAIGNAADALAREISLAGEVVDRIYLGNLTEYRVRTEPFGIVCVRVPATPGATRRPSSMARRCASAGTRPPAWPWRSSSSPRQGIAGAFAVQGRQENQHSTGGVAGNGP